MGIRICDSGDGVAYLYESTSMRPINTEAFDSGEDAESFLALAKESGVFVAAANDETLDELHAELHALPKCDDCGQRIVRKSPRPELCADCCTLVGFDIELEAESA